MKNNKGMTIIEILISVVIISLCLTLLFSLLIQVRNEENNNNIQSSFLINQASFTRQIEEDIVNYGIKAITSCEIGAAGVNTEVIGKGHENDFKCIKIHYAADYIKDNVGFILIYNYYKTYDYEDGHLVGKDAAWSVSYQRGMYRTCGNNRQPVNSTWQHATTLMRELPSEVDLHDTPYVLYTATTGTNAASLVIPIVNLEGEHYDLNLAFTFNGNDDFICSEETGKLECKCQSADGLCSKTLVKEDDASTQAINNIEKLRQHVCPTA